MQNGYIKLYRKIMDSPIWSDPHYLKLWIYCLLKARHKERTVIIGNKTITLYPGQFITGRKTLADDLNEGMKPKQQLSESTWWRYLNNLEDWGMLNIKKTNKYSVVSIVKWHEYQKTEQQTNNKKTGFLGSFDLNNAETEHQNNGCNPYVSMILENENDEIEHQMNNKWTSDEQQMNTNKNVKNDIYTTTTIDPLNFYQQTIGEISPIQVDRLNDWEEEFNGQKEILNEAIRIADDRNRRSFGFVNYLLKEWFDHNLKNLEQIREYEKNKFKKRDWRKDSYSSSQPRTDIPPKRDIDFSEGEDWH